MRRGPGGYRSSAPELARGLSLAFEFAGAVFLFWLLGWLLDEWLGTEPWGQITGSLVGWAGGFLHVYYAAQGPNRRAGVPTRVKRKGTSVPGKATPPAVGEETSDEASEETGK